MRAWFRDLYFGWNHLVRSIPTTSAMILILSLGLGAPTAIWNAIDTLWLRPLPHSDPSRLILLWETHRQLPAAWRVSSLALAEAWREELADLEALALSRVWRPVLGGDELRSLRGARVSAEFFSVMGVSPMIGRDFSADDDLPGAPPVVILSHDLWQRELGGDLGILGATLPLEGRGESLEATVIGILPPRFELVPPVLFEPAEIWMPLRLDPRSAPPGPRLFRAVGRLSAEGNLTRMRSKMAAISRRFGEEQPQIYAEWGGAAAFLSEEILAPRRPALIALSLGVSFLFLVAFIDVALLLLTQAVTRRREVAVRAALGARPGELARQRSLESLILTAVSAALGLLLAAVFLQPILEFGLSQWLEGRDSTFDSRVFFFTVALVLLTTFLFTLLPYHRSGGSSLSASLHQQGGPGFGGRLGRRWRRLFVVLQAALSFLLLVGGALLIRSFESLTRTDPGFVSEGVLSVDLRIPPSRYPDIAQVDRLWRRLLDETETMPRVLHTSLVNHLPMQGRSMSTHAVPAPPNGSPEPLRVELRGVSPHYFRTLSIPLLAGRDLVIFESGGVLLSHSAARALWPEGDAVGRQLSIDWEEHPPFEVVGVVEDILHEGLDSSAKPAIYLPMEHVPHRSMTLIVRTEVDPEDLIADMRTRIREIDPALVIDAVRPLAQVVETTVTSRRGYTMIFVAFALSALLLAAAGTFSVVSYTVARRRYDFSVRLALGARPQSLARSVVLAELGNTAMGLALGSVGWWIVAKLLQGLLFGVSAYDIPTFLSIATLMFLVAGLASFLPARRAMRADPTQTLRAL